jgi:hypothetical protein
MQQPMFPEAPQGGHPQGQLQKLKLYDSWQQPCWLHQAEADSAMEVARIRLKEATARRFFMAWFLP